MLRRGAFAFFARSAAPLCGGVPPVQDLDEIVPGRSIEVGGDFDNLHHSCPQRAVRGLEMIVVGGRADAAALHDLGACAAFEEGFVYDLALRWCELVDVRAKDSAGHAEIERAKDDGRWDAAYDSPANAKIPTDLEAALRQSPGTKEFFESLDSRNRYAILHRLMTAKKPETRAKRLATFVEMLRERRTLHPRRTGD